MLRILLNEIVNSMEYGFVIKAMALIILKACCSVMLTLKNGSLE